MIKTKKFALLALALTCLGLAGCSMQEQTHPTSVALPAADARTLKTNGAKPIDIAAEKW